MNYIDGIKLVWGIGTKVVFYHAWMQTKDGEFIIEKQYSLDELETWYLEDFGKREFNISALTVSDNILLFNGSDISEFVYVDGSFCEVFKALELDLGMWLFIIINEDWIFAAKPSSVNITKGIIENYRLIIEEMIEVINSQPFGTKVLKSFHTAHQGALRNLDTAVTKFTNFLLKENLPLAIKLNKCLTTSHNLKHKICLICMKPIKTTESLYYCPQCDNGFHLPHIREWVKIKGICPLCSSKISSSSFQA